MTLRFRKNMYILFMLLPAFFFLILFYMYPILFNIKISFTDLNFLRMSEKPKFVAFSNYWDFLKSKDFFNVLFNTAFWLTFVTISIRIVLGLLIALLLNSNTLKKLRLTGLFRTLVLIPWATPPVVAVFTWRWLLQQQSGLVNIVLLSMGIIKDPIAFFGDIKVVWFSVVAIIVWNNLPFVVIVFLAALQSIPNELYEAAQVDGAGKISSFFYITLPLILPTISITTLLTVFWTFNNFVYVWLTTAEGPGTFTSVLATRIYTKAFFEYKLGYSSAIGMIMSFIVFVFAIFYLKFVLSKRLEI